MTETTTTTPVKSPPRGPARKPAPRRLMASVATQNLGDLLAAAAVGAKFRKAAKGGGR